MHLLRQLPSFLNSLKLTSTAAVAGGGPVASTVVADLRRGWKGRTLHALLPSDTPLTPASEGGSGGCRVVPVAEDPSAAPSGFRDGSVDFIYLDPPDSGYETVRDALRRWWPKLRSDGGLLGGYAFTDGTYEGRTYGVRSAVQELAATPPGGGTGSEPAGRALQVRLTFDMLPTWYLVKGRVTPRPQTLKIGLLTAYDDAQRPLAEVSSPNKAAYCAKYGYTFIEETGGFDRFRVPAWSKILFLKKHLPYYDWLMWSDTDSLVMDPSRPLEEFLPGEGDREGSSCDMVICHEDLGVGIYHVNAGQFFLRNSNWSMRFLDEVWAQTQFLTDRMQEQRAMIHLLHKSDLSRKVQVVTQRRFNSYPANYRDGDFLLHFPDIPHARRVELMRQFVLLAAGSC